MILGDRSERCEHGHGAQRSLQGAHSLRYISQWLPAQPFSQVLSLETLRKLALPSQDRAHQHRAVVRLANAAPDRVAMKWRSFWQQLIDQAAHQRRGRATEVELL